MPDLNFTVTAVFQSLDDTAHLAELLLFPEVSCLGTGVARLRSRLERHAKDLVAADAPADVYRRRCAPEPELGEVMFELLPPGSRSRQPAGDAELPGSADDAASAAAAATPEAWRDAVRVTFQTVTWAHDNDAHVAFVPALGIEVVAATPEDLRALLPGHVRFALMRRKAATSLRQLVHLQRTRAVRLERVEFTAALKTPRQLAAEAAKGGEPERPVIEEVGVVLNVQVLEPAWELDAVVGQIADALGGRHPRSVLLVGPSGVGKTAAVRELVRRRADFSLGETPFWSSGGARLVAGMSGFGMWQQRCQRLVRETAKARAVLCLGNLVELLEVGKSTHNAQGIATFLRPYLARGEVLAVCECTPEQLAVIERADPHLLDVFHTVRVEEPAPDAAKLILLNAVLAAEPPPRPTLRHGAAFPPEPPALDEDGLETVDRLHRRYATYSAFPARPLRFVRNLLRDRWANVSKSFGLVWTASPPPLSRSDVIAAFARETGLPRFMLDESVPLDLAEARRWFADRLIGQDGAVDLVVELLATVKAALNRPRKPIASLLLIGPTGVGKTELAKLLAEYFFSDRGRLTRFDMSEYASPHAVGRLVGGSDGGEGLLTAKVREQPFSVVLLDEFEKADPALFDLMLQVLGEGRLTDAAGRVADFSNAIVVMTSNLGAESFSQTPFGLAKPQAATGGAAAALAERTGRHFVEAVRDFFRPELFNRIDRVVPFAPLGEAEVLAIARRELDLIARRDGVLLRGMDLRVSDAAVRHLARVGFDARYGARPLKRAIERELLVPLSEAVNAYAHGVELIAEADATDDGGGLRATVRAAIDGHGDGRAPSAAPLAALAGDATALRRMFQRLSRSAAALSLQNELYSLHRLRDSIAERRRRLQKFARRAHDPKIASLIRRFSVHPEEEARLGRLTRVEPVSEAMTSLEQQVVSLEDRTLLGVYDSASAPAAVIDELRAELPALSRAWEALTLSIYILRYDDPDRVLLAVYGDRADVMAQLAAGYVRLATASGGRVVVRQLLRPGTAEDERPLVEKPEAFLADPPAATIGIMLLIHGPNAQPRFAPEAGLHVWVKDKKPQARCLVETAGDGIAAADYPVRFGLGLKEAMDRGERRRTYDLDQRQAEDAALPERPLTWPGREWERVIAQAIDQRLARAAESIVEGG